MRNVRWEAADKATSRANFILHPKNCPNFDQYMTKIFGSRELGDYIPLLWAILKFKSLVSTSVNILLYLCRTCGKIFLLVPMERSFAIHYEQEEPARDKGPGVFHPNHQTAAIQ